MCKDSECIAHLFTVSSSLPSTGFKLSFANQDTSNYGLTVKFVKCSSGQL